MIWLRLEQNMFHSFRASVQKLERLFNPKHNGGIEFGSCAGDNADGGRSKDTGFTMRSNKGIEYRSPTAVDQRRAGGGRGRLASDDSPNRNRGGNSKNNTAHRTLFAYQADKSYNGGYGLRPYFD